MKKIILSALAAAVAASAAFAGPAEDALAAATRDRDALLKGDLRSVFLRLPASEQKKASAAVANFAENVAPDIFKGLMSLAGSLGDVGVENPGLVEEAWNQYAPDGSAAPKAAAIAAAAGALKSLSGKLSLDALKKGDVAALLANPEFAAFAELAKGGLEGGEITGAQLLKNGAVIVSSKDAKGRVSREAYRKVEGVWTAPDAEWRHHMNDAVESLADFEMDGSRKAQALGAIAVAKLGLKKAKKAKTADKLNEALIMAGAPLMMFQ
jgi:hypothetical protein